jgi:hypothetical protein
MHDAMLSASETALPKGKVPTRLIAAGLHGFAITYGPGSKRQALAVAAAVF